MTPSDETLVKVVLAGEQSAYKHLYDRYAPLVRAICFDATSNLAEAQDLAQDVFMRAYERLYYLKNPDRFGRWLVGIAWLRCREWWRETSHRQRKLTMLRDIKSVTVVSSDDHRTVLLRKMISTLPEKERLVLHVFYLQDKSADNACRIMGMSRSGFYRLLDRSRKHLERLLVREEKNI